jgi:hypothetical protein
LELDKGIQYAQVGGHREAIRKTPQGRFEAYDPAQPLAPGIPLMRRHGEFRFDIDKRYIATPPEPLSAPNAQGIRSAGGKNYVTIGKHDYRVVQDRINRLMAPDQEHQLWRIFDETQHTNEFGYIPAKDTVPIMYHPRTKQWRIADTRLRGGNPIATSHELIASGRSTFEVTHTTAVESADAQRQAARRMLDPSQWQSDSDALIRDAAYRKEYRSAFFFQLSGLERRALRNWSEIGIGSRRYPAGEEPIRDGIHYELNRALARGHYDWRSDPLLETNYGALQTALRGLPKTPQSATLLRVADVPASYRDLLAVGDIVTNAPLFMSASSHSDYANMAISEQGAAHGDISNKEGSMLAFYSIKSLSAKPFMPGISAKRKDLLEGEYLFGIDSRFRVDAVSIAKPTAEAQAQAKAESREEKTRMLIQMTELPYDSSAAFVNVKNMHTGRMQRVYAPDRDPPPAAERTGLPDGVRTPHQSRVDGPYNIDYYTSVQASTEQLDRILSFENWSTDVAGFLDHLRRAKLAESQLPEKERSALRKWVADHGSDSSDEIPYFDVQRAYENLDPDAMTRRNNLELGLEKLPTLPAKLLRVASVPIDAQGRSVYNTRIKPGDFVSNGQRFMSASDDNGYALANNNVDADEALVYYEIDSHAARLLPDTVGPDREQEWLFMPNRVFAVDGIAVRNPLGASNEPPRIAVKLREVDEASVSGSSIKHIISGESCTSAGREALQRVQEAVQTL